jgi:hypothetical protein
MMRKGKRRTSSIKSEKLKVKSEGSVELSCLCGLCVEMNFFATFEVLHYV